MSEEVEIGAPRPRSLGDFVGNEDMRSNLRIFMDAALERGEALDHVLLTGPPGLGKTTMAHVISREMGANMKVTSGPVFQRAGDLAAQLSGLEEGDVLFVDEVHRLSASVEEALYPAMEDFALDVLVGSGLGARSVRVGLKRFTLIGATTRPGLLSNPLRDRFGITLRFDYYEREALERVALGASRALGLEAEGGALKEIARRSRGTPRVAVWLLRRVRDFAGGGVLSEGTARDALTKLGVDEGGLDELDRRYLGKLTGDFRGAPVGLETLTAALGESRDALEGTVEPYLVREGLVMRTMRGRVATSSAYERLGVKEPSGRSDLFGGSTD